MEKRELKTTVFDAALLRLDRLFNTYGKVCISLSGGKCSTILLHLAAAVARVNSQQFTVLFVDREAHHARTIEHIHEMKNLYDDVINAFYWVALPLSNAQKTASQEPGWVSWEKGVEWWRTPPQQAITDSDIFPFYRDAMRYDEFITAFLEWLSAGNALASVLGTTADDILDHDVLMALADNRDYHGENTKELSSEAAISSFYPLFDWQEQDIWLFNSLSKAIYNPLYDIMYRSGVTLAQMKIHEPFEMQITPDLHSDTLYTPYKHARYNNRDKVCVSSEKKGQKPLGCTWENYASHLLNTMPYKIADQYRENIARYINLHHTQGYCRNLPDEQQCTFESNGLASWEKICGMILANDYRCQVLADSAVPHRDAGLRKKERRGKGNEAIFLQ